MGHLFWKFFFAIWLTILGAIGVIMITNAMLNVLPPREDRPDFRARFAVDAVSEMIGKGEVQSAKDYLAALKSARHPLNLPLKAIDAEMDEDTCKIYSDRFARVFDPREGRCYQIDVRIEPPTFLQRYLPPFLPPLAVLLTSSISALLLARYLVRPIMTVRNGLNALANGNFSIRIKRLSGWWPDEITALGHDFDVTAGKIEELQESQRRLFHDVSHEIRSPLFRIQAVFGLLRQNPAKLDALMPRMKHEIERIDDLVEEILTLARLGPTAAPLSQDQPLDVIDLISAVVDDAAFEAEPRSIEISYKGIESFVSRVNGELIYRAIENVLRNAVKYSRTHSIIALNALPDGDNLRISITNEGLFVPPQDIDRMFEPFTRLSEDSSTATGHGLGLAIARQAIERHGGRVWAVSNPVGGVTVEIELPRLS